MTTTINRPIIIINIKTSGPNDQNVGASGAFSNKRPDP